MIEMKGPNPFSSWEQDPSKVYGRKDEALLFKAFMNSLSAKQPGILIIKGIEGSGKSALIRYFRHLAEKEGLICPLVKAERGENLEAIVDKLYQEVKELPGFVKKEEENPLDFRSLIKSVGLDRKHFGVVYIIDNIDNIKKTEELIKKLDSILKEFWGKRRISFVLSTTRELKINTKIMKILELDPYDEHKAREFVEKSLKDKKLTMGEECLTAILDDTDGNPQLFKSVCRNIYDRIRDDEKRITKGHYFAYLPYIMSMLSREWFGRIYQEIPKAEREILLEISKHEEGVHVSDIAKKLNKPLGPITALVKRLLDRGQIIRLSRGKYKVFSKLYGKYVIKRSQ